MRNAADSVRSRAQWPFAAERREQFGRRLAREVDASAVEVGGGYEVDLHLRDDPEVAAPAAQGPEQVGLGVRGDLAQLAVRG